MSTVKALAAVICLGAVLLSASCTAGGLTVFDFEDGTMQGWQVVSGEAGCLPTGPETARPDVLFNQQGDYFIGLYENPRADEATVVLQSPTFTISSRTISLLVGGGMHEDSCYVALYRASDNSELARETGRNCEYMDRRYWDVSEYVGEQVYMRIVDSRTGGWGHINVDDIRELTPAEQAERESMLAEKERRYEQWLASVAEPSKRKVYTGDALEDIAFPLGGIGSGHLAICGDGGIRQWEFFNRVNDACVVPDSFFAIWTKCGARKTARVLQQSSYGELPGVQKVEFIGEYPIAQIKYLDPALPVEVSLRAFSPHIPMNPKDSAIPAAVFEFTLRNNGRMPVQFSLLSTLQNAVGYDGLSKIEGVWNEHYGGNTNTVISERGLRGVLMTNPLMDKDARQYGSMALSVVGEKGLVTPQWDNLQLLWQEFERGGEVGAAGRTGSSKPGRTWNAAVTVPWQLRPGGETTITFIWSWHFPNNYVWWDGREGQPRIGRMYNNWFEDASRAAIYLAQNYSRLSADTERFRRAFYRTTLPYWMLDRILAQSSTLVSNVAMWIEDGSFVCFEGAGCCPMNCTHVWNYEQLMAYLFPVLERNMRRTDLEIQQMENGAVRHRTRLPLNLPRESGPFVDGHLGTILKCYREYRQSADSEWLDYVWPRIKLAMQFVLNEWDRNNDGVLVNEQWNTYDAAMYGPNTFIGTLYLAALRASEEMAKAQADYSFAEKVRAVFETGSRRLDSACWNGEYYYHIKEKPSEEEAGMNDWLLEEWPIIRNEERINRPYGKGCHADQLLGQWWAHTLGLGYLLPQVRVDASLSAIMKYNWVRDFGDVLQTPRAFAGKGDAGLYNCTWPKGKDVEWETLYSYEVWTGIEYEVAGLLLYEGRVDEAYQIVKAVSDRYNGAARPPIKRNPWAEVECGNHYARAMSSWGLLLAAQGYSYCGPEKSLGFNPVVQPDDHVSFFTSAEGWGVFSQRREAKRQTNALEVDYGTLEVKRLTYHLPASAAESCRQKTVRTAVDGRYGSYVTHIDGTAVTIEFVEPVIVRAPDKLATVFIWE